MRTESVAVVNNACFPTGSGKFFLFSLLIGLTHQAFGMVDHAVTILQMLMV